jgi:ketosteroid isomerase-like protein
VSTKDLSRARASGSAEEAVLEALRSGFRDRDAARVASVYADDVVSTIVNRNNPPSRPLVLRGRDAVTRMVEDLCSREMTHQISRVVVGDGSLAYRVECRYPDGCNVVGMYMATVEGGRIVKEFSVDCWDE